VHNRARNPIRTPVQEATRAPILLRSSHVCLSRTRRGRRCRTPRGARHRLCQAPGGDGHRRARSSCGPQLWRFANRDSIGGGPPARLHSSVAAIVVRGSRPNGYRVFIRRHTITLEPLRKRALMVPGSRTSGRKDPTPARLIVTKSSLSNRPPESSRKADCRRSHGTHRAAHIGRARTQPGTNPALGPPSPEEE
jgi:hypothetical protein